MLKLNEITRGLIDKYVERATAAHGHYNMARRNTTGDTQKYFARKEKNTQKGISRALDDKRRMKTEASDMCNVCGQTPCNCTHIEEQQSSIPLKRTTMIQRAIRRAQKTPEQVAKTTYGVGYRSEEVQIDEIKMSDDEYKSGVESYGKRATNLLKHSWSQHDVSKEKAKAGDKEGAAKAAATGSRAHKLFLKAKEKHLQNPERAEAYRKKIMSGASDYYKSKKPGQYTGDSFDPTLTNSNPYIGEGLVDEAREASYDGNYQSTVLAFKAKVKKQEQERGPVDIEKLAARLRAVKLPPEGKKK